MLLTNRQTNKQTDSKILPTPTDIVGVGNNNDDDRDSFDQVFSMPMAEAHCLLVGLFVYLSVNKITKTLWMNARS